MKKFIEKIDKISYEIFKFFILSVYLFCKLFISWMSFFFSLGSLIHGKYNEGFLALLICVLSIVLWKGGENIYETLINVENKK